MTGSADWFARKLGGGGGTAQPSATPRYPATSTPPAWRPPPLPRPGDHTRVTEQNFHEMAGQWQGGKGVADAAMCPRCGSDALFSRSTEKKINVNTGQTCTPAPICYECGYNGMFEQIGNRA